MYSLIKLIWYFKWNNYVTRKEENCIAFVQLNTCISEHIIVRLHSIYGTDIGRSIKMATDNIHSIGVVKPVYGIPNFPLTATAM